MNLSMDVLLPIELIHDRRLDYRSKMLYGIVFTMAKDYGYCVPTNRELSFHFGVSEGRVSYFLGKLEELCYIVREMVYDPNTLELMERRLYLTSQPWIKIGAAHEQRKGNGLK